MRCDENLVRLNDVLKRAALVQTDLKPNEDGTCTVRLFFSDDSGPLMDLKLLSPSLRQGQLLSARFHDTPETIYHDIMALLGRAIEKGGDPQ